MTSGMHLTGQACAISAGFAIACSSILGSLSAVLHGVVRKLDSAPALSSILQTGQNKQSVRELSSKEKRLTRLRDHFGVAGMTKSWTKR